MSVASDLERLMLDLINAERAAHDLDPVVLELRLNAAAEDHSEWMLEEDRFSHTGEGGSSPTQRMQDAGFVLSGSWRTAENIAWQSVRGAPGLADDVEDLHNALMNSPGHRANILSKDATVIGIGIEIGDFDGWSAIMVTQKYAKTSAPVQTDTIDPTPVTDTPPVSEPVDNTPPAPEPIADAPPVPEPVADAPPAPAPIAEAPSGSEPMYVAKKASGGDGDDYMILTSTNKGRLNGRDGDDHLVGSESKDKLNGGKGDDLLQGNDNNDVLRGHKGNDILEGGEGNDILNGGRGLDVLTGGGGADTFFFTKGNAQVTDFEDSDMVNLTKSKKIDSYSDLVENHMSQSGSDVVIDDGSGNTMVLEDTQLSSLDQGDFIF